MASPRFSLDREDLHKILKAFAFSVMSAACVALLAIVQHTEVPQNYFFAIPIFNALLVAVKKWADDHTAE